MEQRFFLDEVVAERYDASSSEMFDPAVLGPTVEFLAGLAAGGSALEFGIGTGRVALPLSKRGVRVHGIDLSAPMLAQLQAKPGSDAIGITRGNFANTRVAERFDLVYLVYNAINTFTTQDEQVEAVLNAAAHLKGGGHLVTEAWVPALQRLPPGETVRAFKLAAEHLGFEEYDVVDQSCTSHHYVIDEGSFERHSSPGRYVWPSELDLMARLAGLTFRERWGTWTRTPFTADSTDHISVWQKAGDL